MKNILLFIISIFIIQSALAQKVDWNKPLYEVEIKEEWMTCCDCQHDFRIPDDWKYYNITDTFATYSYLGDTMIYKNKYHGGKKAYLRGKIIEERDYYNHSIYQYDSLWSLSTKMHIGYLHNQIAYEYSDTISYTNTYDKQNRLIKIKGTDKKKIVYKYRRNKIIENSHTPKDRYHRIYYYKDPDYQNDTLITTYTLLNCNYTRTEYDSLNRPIRVDKWADSGVFCEKGYNYTTYKYIDNMKICEYFDVDCLSTYGTLYKKEEE